MGEFVGERFVVRYYAGPYSGEAVVWAEDEAEAIEKVRRRTRKEMILPMYSDGYRVVGDDDTAGDDHG